MRNSTTSLFTARAFCGLYLLTVTRLAAAELPVMPKFYRRATNLPPERGRPLQHRGGTAAGTAAGTTTGTTTGTTAGTTTANRGRPPDHLDDHRPRQLGRAPSSTVKTAMSRGQSS